MCRFLSFLVDENGKMYYLSHDVRMDIENHKSNLYPDSHTSIADYYKINEDKCDAYEFNPLTGNLVLDKKNISGTKYDIIPKDELLFMVHQAVPELIVKPVINPFADRNFNGEITDDILQMLKSWKIINSRILEIDKRTDMEQYVADSAYYSVISFVSRNIFDFVESPIRIPIYNQFRNLIADSLNLSVYDSDWKHVNNSLWDLMYVYISSFFDLPKWITGDNNLISEGLHTNFFQAAIDLWELGLIPSFDGTKWRLHSYKGVVYEEE